MSSKAPKEFTQQDIKDEKQQNASSVQADSGFISGSNLISSESSINSEGEEINDQPEVALEPEKVAETNSDFALASGFNNLSLKSESPLDDQRAKVLSQLHSNDEEISKNICTSTNDGRESKSNLWQMYYRQDDDGDTQLHIAVSQSIIPVATYLIGLAPHPCLLNIKNDQCQTALHIAVYEQNPQLVRTLIIADADPILRNRRGNTPLHQACTVGDFRCVRALTQPTTPAELKLFGRRRSVQLPQNLELKNYDGYTCLHLAALNGHVDIVKYLVSIGANTEEREMRGGRTALHLAVEFKQSKVIGVLARECKSHLEALSWARYTPYHIAYESDMKIAQELKRLGAVPSLPPSFESDDDSDDYDSDDDDDDDDYDEDDNQYENGSNVTDQISNLHITSNIPLVVPTSS